MSTDPLRDALEHIIECVRPNTTAGAIPERTVDADARILADHLTEVASRALAAPGRPVTDTMRRHYAEDDKTRTE